VAKRIDLILYSWRPVNASKYSNPCSKFVYEKNSAVEARPVVPEASFAFINILAILIPFRATVASWWCGLVREAYVVLKHYHSRLVW